MRSLNKIDKDVIALKKEVSKIKEMLTTIISHLKEKANAGRKTKDQ